MHLQALSPEHRAIIRVLIIGVLLPLLDTTLVNVALHDIGRQLDAPLATTQWVTTAYTLTAASIVPLSAWAANRVGGKRLWLASLTTFLAGTILSAMAWNVATLILGRVIQGLAAGLMMPVMQTILVNAVGQERAKTALAAMAVPSVIAPILGPLLGGIVLQQAGWREIFWLHVPICLLGIYLAARRLPNDGPLPDRPAFDVHGFLLLCPGMVLTMYALSTMGIEWGGFAHQSAWLSGFGISLMVLFALHANRWGSRALVDLTLFKHLRFRASAGLLLLSSVIYYGGLLLLPLYFIQVGHYSAEAAGALLALHGVGTLVSRRYLAPLSLRWGDRNVALGAILATLIGSGALCWPLLPAHSYLLAMAMIVRGAGVGVLTIQAMSSAYVGLDRPSIAHASSLTRMFTHLGATMGAAGSVALIGSSTMGHSAIAFASGFDAAFVGMMVVALLCVVPAYRLGRQ
ncbi:MFS transporter [Variovorax paradoxus]|nr:MFS transporter [Variovorax paradoxus]